MALHHDDIGWPNQPLSRIRKLQSEMASEPVDLQQRGPTDVAFGMTTALAREHGTPGRQRIAVGRWGSIGRGLGDLETVSSSSAYV
jgi:hypothetical protein